MAKFEADAGKASQIINRSSGDMARATEKADAAVRRLAERYAQVGIESKVVASAMAGASDTALKMFANISSGGAAFARVGDQGSAAFRAIGVASETELAKTQSRILLIAEKVRQVREQAATLTQAAVSQRESGSLTDDSLKIRLAGIRAAQKADLERIATAARADSESQRAAAAEAAVTNQRITAFEKLRATVAQLNFKQQQEQAVALKATADADIAANEKRKASAQSLIDKLNGVPEAYRRQLEVLQASLKAGDITPKQFQTSVLQATAQRSDVQKFKQEQETAAAAIVTAEKRIAAEAQATADARVIAARRIIDVQNGLTAGYREQLKQLRDLRDAGSITQQQFRQAGASLVSTQPAVNADPALVDRIRQAAVGMNRFGASAASAAAKTKLTNYELQTLNFTVSDVIASLASGISPMTILLQQGGQVRDVFGGFGSFFTKIGSLFTPLRVALGGVALAVGGLVTAFIQGKNASREFADALVLSGNFAGQTEGTFNALAKSISASGQVNVASAREFAQALVSTGEIGPRVFAVATEAAVRFGTATGKSAKDVASEFASMSRDVTAGANKLNQSLNFLTASQLQHIKTLQDEGRAVEAQTIVYDALLARLRGLEPNLGLIDIAIRNVTVNWSRFWDAALDVGRTKGPEDKLAEIENRLNKAANNPNFTFAQRQTSGVLPALSDAQRAELEGQRATLLSEKATTASAAASAAAAAETTKLAVAGRSNVESLLKSGKSASIYAQELKKLNSELEVNRKAGTPFTPIEEAQARAELKKRFTATPDRSAESEAEALRKARLAADLQFIKDKLQQEQDVFRFNQQELQAIYSAGSISLKAFFDAKEAFIREGVQGQLDALVDEQKRLEVEIAKPGLKGSQKVDLQREIDKSIELGSRIKRKADDEAILGDLDRVAATKVLMERIEDFRAQLQQLEGDDEGAAAARARRASASAQALAKQSGGIISADELARTAKAIQVSDQLAEVQRRVALSSNDAARAEELYLLRATRGGASLIEQEQSIYTIRAASLVQLGELRDKAAALAAQSTDPRVKAAAEDLALQYARAADSVDPALNRLRENVKSTADAITDDIGNAINDFKGFPALIDSISKDLVRAGTKFFVTDPLKIQMENVFKTISEGDNPVGNFLKGVAGVGGGGDGGTSAQTAAVTASTSAISTMSAAASAAAAALGSLATSSSVSGAIGGGGGFGTGVNFGNMDYGAFFHEGGVVGSGGVVRAVPRGTWASALRYRGGGIAGLKPDEVPAILHRREEVLRRDDPRHRWNGGNTPSERATPPLVIQVQAAPGASRESAQQFGVQAGMGIQRAIRRGG